MGSVGTSLLAWLLFPAVAYALFAGIGLLVERAARITVPNALVAPIGLCATIVIVAPLYRTGAGAWLATPAAVVAAVAGYALARGDLGSRLNPGWLGLAGLAAYWMVMAPVVAAGGWTWTGYNFVNDTSVQLLLADHLAHHGMSKPPGPPDADPQSTGLEHIRIYLETGYPLGVHTLLATLRPLGLAPFEAVYQPLIGMFAAMAALSLGSLLRRVANVWLAVVGGLLAVGANLVYQYALQGSLKEIGMLAAFGTSAAVARHLLDARVTWRLGALLGLLLGACVLVYSTAALPYVGGLAALTALVALVRRDASFTRREVMGAAAVAVLVAVLAALPALSTLVRFGEVAGDAFASSAAPDVGLGHLLRPLKLAQTAGVWLTDDYRVPVVGDNGALNDGLIVLILILAVAGMVYVARRREPGLLLFAGPAAVALAVVAPRVSPYADAKLLVLLTPGVMLLAFAGIAAVEWRRRSAAVLLAAVVAGAIMWSDGLAYHRVQLAPVERLQALEDIGDRYAGKGLMLVNDFEQFAKYFMRDARENVAAEAITPHRANLRSSSYVNLQIDVDQETTGYLSYFAYIVERKGADASRPPANYRLDYENDYYTVWRRDESSEVLRHKAVQPPFFGADRLDCREVLDFAHRADPGEKLAVSLRPTGERLDTAAISSRSPSWRPHSYIHHTVVTEEPGQASTRATFDGGRYRIWVFGSFGRDVAVLVDGSEVGRVHGVNTEGEWLDGGLVNVPQGEHEIELLRGGGGIAPGDGFKGVLGPLAFQPVYPTDSLVWVKAGDVRRRVCGQDVDWMEIVRR